MESELPKHRYTAEFRVIGAFDPDEITAGLELTPTTAWRVGEAANPRARDTAVWGYAAMGEYRYWDTLEEPLSKLIDELQSHM